MRLHGDAVQFTRYDLDAVWDRVRGWGLAMLLPDPIAMGGLLLGVASVQLPLAGGLAVHGASLVRNGQAVLFPAASGVGKSTLAARSGGTPPLSDEISLLRPGPLGGPPYVAYPSPFWSPGRRPSVSSPPDAAEAFPLARIGFLDQGKTLRRHPLRPDEATDLLMRHCLAYGASSELALAVLDACASVCAAVPADRVELPLGPSVWALYEELLG